MTLSLSVWIGTCQWLSCHPDAMSAPLRPAPQSPPKGPLTRQAVPRHPVQCRERAAWRCDGPAAAERSGRGPTWCVAGAPARTITSSIRGHRHPLGPSVEGGRSGGRATWAAAPSHVGGAGGAWAVGAHAPLPRPPEAPSPGRAVPMHPVQGWMHAARRCGGLGAENGPYRFVLGQDVLKRQHERSRAAFAATGTHWGHLSRGGGAGCVRLELRTLGRGGRMGCRRPCAPPQAQNGPLTWQGGVQAPWARPRACGAALWGPGGRERPQSTLWGATPQRRQHERSRATVAATGGQDPQLSMGGGARGVRLEHDPW